MTSQPSAARYSRTISKICETMGKWRMFIM